MKNKKLVIISLLMICIFFKSVLGIGFSPNLVSNNASQLNTPIYSVGTDLDSDGDIDIVYSGSDKSMYWFENVGGSYTETHLIQDTDLYVSLIAIDLDQDNDIDIIAMDSPFNDSLVWWKNDGNELFTRTVIWSRTKGSYNPDDSFDIVDMDDDNDLDIVLCDNPDFGNYELFWLENLGTEDFVTQHNISVGENCGDWVKGIDLDNDTDMDVVHMSGSNLRWKENRGGGVWDANLVGTAGSQYVNAPDIFDYDDDGDLDVMAGSATGSVVYVYDNNGFETFTKTVFVSIASSGLSTVRGTDFDGDNLTDVVIGDIDLDDILLYKNNGTGYEFSYVTQTLDGPKYFSLVDMDNDGDLDILYQQSSPEKIIWYENQVDAQLSIVDYTCTETLISDSFDYSDNYVNHGWTESISSPYDVPVQAFVTNAFGIDNTTAGSVSTTWADSIYQDSQNDIYTGTVIASMDYYIYSSNDSSDYNNLKVTSPTGKYLSFQYYLYYDQYRIDTNADGGEDCYMDLEYSIPAFGHLVVEIDLDNNKYSAYLTGNSYGCYNIELGDFGGIRELRITENIKDVSGTPQTYDKYFDYVQMCKGFVEVGEACQEPSGLEEQYYCDGDTNTVYRCFDFAWTNYSTCEFNCAINDTATDSPASLCALPNDIPVMTSVSPYYIDGWGSDIYTSSIPETQNIYFKVTATDNEGDPLYVAVDCDNSFGPPYVLAWSAINVLNTEATPCNYTAGSYTAKVYVTDSEHNWSEPYGYLEFDFVELSTTSCDTQCIGNVVYDCNFGWVKNCESYPSTPWCADALGDCAECNDDTSCISYFGQGYFCNTGYECEQQANCTDTDSGIDYAVKGTTTDPNSTLEDYCQVFANNTLREYYCVGDTATYVDKDCSEVGAGYSCNDGACTYSACTNPTAFEGQYVCSNDKVWNCTGDGTLGWVLVNNCNATYGGEQCYNGTEGVAQNEIQLPNLCTAGPDCNDSDNGINYFIEGYTVEPSTGDIEIDGCINSTFLVERYCSGDYQSTVYKYCTDFGENYICTNGKCSAGEIVFTNCTDTDSGMNYFVKGYVEDGNYPNITYWDACESVTEGVQALLWEVFCSDIGYDVIAKNCLLYGDNYMCYDGACIQRPENCADIDGVDYFEASYVLDTSGGGIGYEYYDFCTGDILSEYICVGETPDTVEIDCSYYTAYPFCLNGKCSTGECVDSDGGVNYASVGTITLGGGLYEYTDYCSEKYVNEYYCEDETTALITHYCESGCSGGSCIGITNPSSADIDSPWYRDENNTLHFNASKCENWKSMLMCAGFKYSMKQIATGASWVFSGVHILYFIIILIIVIIVGPLLVEFFRPRPK